MILISHRGNINGKIPGKENNPEYIDRAISLGYEVEIDIWCIEGVLLLGHDEPQYGITQQWLNRRSQSLWIHCKTVEAMEWFNTIGGFNYFWHEEDTVTLTSKGFIWSVYPIPNGVLVMPESTQSIPIDTTEGICSDFIGEYA